MSLPASGPPVQFVSSQDSERLIFESTGQGAASPEHIFGPGSVTWKINRESALFLGAGRAALLQLAHPWVATAIEQHSNVMANPIARFHNTFRIVFTMIFGTAPQAAAAARHLYGVHTHIHGDMSADVAAYPRGSHYQANEVAALRWVFATLIESAVLAYNFALPPLSGEECEAYYAETKKLAALFGIAASALPADWDAFVAYCRAMEESQQLGVSAKAREMAQGLLAGAGSWIRPPRWYRALTAAWLPERFRAEFGLRMEDTDVRALASARRWFPRVYRRVPGPLRLVGPWHEAQARLAGRAAGLVARAGNRFWIGQTRMPFAS